MERLKWLLAVIFLLAAPWSIAQTKVFSMAAQATLDKEFGEKQLSYLLLGADGTVLAQRWPEGVETPVAPGSLLKPWLAVAYAEQYQGAFPQVECRGTKGRCWYSPGHGLLGLEQAMASSCNAYFLQLAAKVDREQLHLTVAHYGLHGPNQSAQDEDLMGLGAQWKESPLTLGRAYLTLMGERNQAVQSAILQGMQASASSGTAQAIGDVLGRDVALAKTGTAACSHVPHGAGDGFALAIFPAAQPRLLLLVRVHGSTGASSARVVASMLKALGAGVRR